MLEVYPQLNAAQANADAIGQAKESEKTSWHPSLSLNVRSGAERYEDLLANDFSSGRTNTASLSANQLLYDGGLSQNNVRAASYRHQASLETIADLRESKTLELATTYIDIIKHRRLIELAEANVKTHQDALEKISQKYQSGAAPRADVDLLNARMAMAQATVESRRLQLKRSESTYKNLTGEAPVALSLPDFPKVAARELAVTEDFSTAPRIRAAESNLELARVEQQGTRSQYRPRLSLALQNDYRDSTRSSTISEESSALIVLSYNIFDGGRRRSELKRNRSLIYKAEFDKENALWDSRLRFDQARDEIEATEDRIGHLVRYSQSIETVAHAYQEQFNLGQRALINLLDIENELFSARSSLEEENLILYQATYRLISATGRLVESL